MKTNYLIKVWTSVITVTPLLMITLILIETRFTGIDSGLLGFYVYALLLGALFSSPTLLIFWFLSFIKKSRNENIAREKVYYISVSLICMLLTLQILFGSNDFLQSSFFGSYTFSIFYGVSIIFFGLLHKPE